MQTAYSVLRMAGLACLNKLMKLLLATDGSRFSAAATQAVIAHVKRDGTEVRAIHVVDPRKELLPEMNALDAEVMNAPAQRRSAEALVETTGELLRAEGLKATTVVVWGDPRSKIIEVAKEWRADLIVLGSHGRTEPKGSLMEASQMPWRTAPLVQSRSCESKGSANAARLADTSCHG